MLFLSLQASPPMHMPMPLQASRLSALAERLKARQNYCSATSRTTSATAIVHLAQNKIEPRWTIAFTGAVLHGVDKRFRGTEP
jgi:hypothetical protein